jgi:uncharacterized metal-binding protein YceD (DUF177 family)
MTDPEFARPFRLDTLGDQPRAVKIAAEEHERAALARRFGLLAIERLEATAELRMVGEAVLADGRLRAAVTQACVASGEPVQATIDEPFTLRFVSEDMAAAEDEVELAEGDLDVMTFDGGTIDLGEAAAQTLALALDPFPRAANATAVLRAAGVVEEGEEEKGPFAALKALKDRL